MRILTIVLSVLIGSSAWAFDSAAWLKKRAARIADAERLRKAYAACVQALETPAEDVMIPVETFPDGSVKLLVAAKKAQYFLETGLVWAEDVTVKKFKRDGSLDMLLEAKNCIVDRMAKSGWAEGAATLTQGESVFRGKDVYFSSPDSYVRVTRESDLDSKNLKGVEGLK